MPERLDKCLTATGRFTRREAREAIRNGRVTVAGQVAAAPEAKVAEGAVITVDGQTLAPLGPVYLMLNKPAGVLTATRDARQPTVLELVPPEYKARGVAPVGRLDRDTEGLLLLTDNGPLAHFLLSPKRHVDKTYRVEVAGTLTAGDEAALAAGLTLADGLQCLPARLVRTADPAVGLLTIQEGKFHQVKRMMAALGKPVTGLRRLSMGPLTLDDRLSPGGWRPLTAEEREALLALMPPSPSEISSKYTKNLP